MSGRKNSTTEGVSERSFCCKSKKNFAICCSISCAGCLLITGLVIGIAIGAAAGQTFSAGKFSNLIIEGENKQKIHTYVAEPQGFNEQQKRLTKYPVAILFHAWNGLSEDITYFADKLAAHGYYAIVPDLFRGTASEGTNFLWNSMNMLLFATQKRMDADVDMTLNYLLNFKPRKNNTVDVTRITSGPGFCYGGTQSLILSSRWNMAGTVTLYGTYIQELKEKDAKAWGKIGHPDSRDSTKYTAPVMGIYGDLDTRPSPAQAKAFEKALNERGIPNRISIYEGVNHAFVKKVAHKKESHPGHSRAVAAWDEIVTFMKSNNATSDLSSFEYRRNRKRRRKLRSMLTTPSEAGMLLSPARVSSRSMAVTAVDSTVADSTPGDRDSFQVAESVSLWHRIQCAMKCGWDMIVGGGHAE